MARYLEFYDKEKTYYYPNNKVATPQEDFPIVDSGLKVVIETDVNGLYFYTAPVPVNVKANEVGVDVTGLSEEDALQVLMDKLNEPIPEPEPTSEERIAAALEYQNLMSM